MSKYTIDTTLYEAALQEMFDNFMRANPIRSELSRATIEQSVREHAISTFYMLWQSATKMNEDHNSFRASQVSIVSDPIDKRALAQLDEKSREHMRQFHEDTAAMLRKGIGDRQKIFDDAHRSRLIVLFTAEMGGGLNKATAEKIVDEHILVHKEA